MLFGIYYFDEHYIIPDMIHMKIRFSELLFPTYFWSRLYISMGALLFCVMSRGPSPTLNIRCVADTVNVQSLYIFADCMCVIIYLIYSCSSSSFFQITCFLASRNWGYIFPRGVIVYWTYWEYKPSSQLQKIKNGIESNLVQFNFNKETNWQ